jgi:hypothetical protein
VNAFDLLSQLFIFGFKPALALGISPVVIAAGGKARYLAGFRN